MNYSAEDVLNMDVDQLKSFANEHPEKYWEVMARNDIYWHKDFTESLLDKFSHQPQWFVNGKINMCYNCLDKPIAEGYGDQLAVIYENFVEKSSLKFTYKQLNEEVSKFAEVLHRKCQLSWNKDKVLIYMPVIPQCLIAMLACTKLGLTYCNVYGGYPAKELSERIKHLEPSVVITVNFGYSNDQQLINYKSIVDTALSMASSNQIKHCIVYNRRNLPQSNMTLEFDLDWLDSITNVSGYYDVVPVPSDHPIYILYTSGTTGNPKGFAFSTGGSLVFKKTSFRNKTNNSKGIVWFCFSDFGWISGQDLLSYSAFLKRSTTVLLEGGLVDESGYSCVPELIYKHKINWMFLSPSSFRLLRNRTKLDLKNEYPSLKNITSGGELCDKTLKKWIEQTFNVNMIIGWGQTELGGETTSSCWELPMGKETYINDNTMRIIPGINVGIYEEITGQITHNYPSNIGKIIIKLPLIPGAALTLYKNHEKFYQTYFKDFPGYYDTKDNGKLSDWGSLEISGRNDDVIKVKPILLSTGDLESIANNINEIEYSAFVGLNDDIHVQIPFGFLIIKKEFSTITLLEIINKVAEKFRESYGEFSCFNNAILVEDLPRSITGKVHRKSLGQMINRQPFDIPAVIENKNSYAKIYKKLIESGFQAFMPL